LIPKFCFDFETTEKTFEFSISEKKTGRAIMKACGFLVLVSLLITPHLVGDCVSCEAKRLPAPIEEFYADWNHLCAFSTSQERMELLSYLESRSLPPRFDSPRLSDILHKMGKIKDQTLIADPKMLAKTKKPSPLLRNLFCRTEFLKTEKFLRSEDRISVKLEIVELLPEDVLRFIERYEEEKERGPAVSFFEHPGSGAEDRRIHRTEYHDWVRIDGKWKRRDGSYLLLKRENGPFFCDCFSWLYIMTDY
jgi:hypothetical protein